MKLHCALKFEKVPFWEFARFTSKAKMFFFRTERPRRGLRTCSLKETSLDCTFFRILERPGMAGNSPLSINFESAKCCQLVRHGYWDTNSTPPVYMIQLFKVSTKWWWKVNRLREIRFRRSVVRRCLQSQLLYSSQVAEILIWSSFLPPKHPPKYEECVKNKYQRIEE